MKFYTYLVAWDEVHYNCVEIDEQFMAAGQPITVINSGEMKRDHWDNVGDIRYYRQFYHALKNFDMSYDYMAFMCGDVSYTEWSNAIDRATEILSKYDNAGLYAPHFTHEPWSESASKITQVEDDENLNISIQTDGIYVFIRKDIVSTLLEYFNFLNEQINMADIKSGWGLDMIWSSIAIANNLPILRDKRYVLFHPAGSSYNHDRATEEMNIVVNNFYKYLDSKGIDSKLYGELHRKIYGRMSRYPDCMLLSDFYSQELILKNPVNIDYHVIYINDDRKYNRDLIDSKLHGTKQDIKSLNAKDPGLLSEFYIDNPEFRVSIQPKLGEIGNFGSHYLAWKYLVNSKLNSLLVFEDDSIIHEDFIEKYSLALNNVPEDFDVLSIYIDPNQYDRFHQSDYINKYIAKGYQDWSTLCYVVSRQGAQKLIRYVIDNGMDYPTDWFIFRHGHAGLFNVYTLAPGFHSPLEIDKQYESQVQ